MYTEQGVQAINFAMCKLLKMLLHTYEQRYCKSQQMRCYSRSLRCAHGIQLIRAKWSRHTDSNGQHGKLL